MSLEYDEYLEQHRANVLKGFKWFEEKLPGIFPPGTYAKALHQVGENNHDWSKYDPEEYEAYDAYFYGKNRTRQVVDNFNRAWLRHIHLNPHHWQHWVLIHDDEPEEVLPIPFEYIIEMICDWWSFSWKTGNLAEIFDWYEKQKNMKLNPETRKTVEDILAKMKQKLEVANESA